MPLVIFKLKNLRKLVLSSNQKLASVSKMLLDMASLEEVECFDCQTLNTPPTAVAEQGLSAIRQYFRDIELFGESSSRMSVTTAAVLGCKMAGKSSFIQSMKHRRRQLTTRHQDAPFDEGTKVFDVEPVEIDGTEMRMFDFGGDEAYHVTYQLTLREHCIPIIVVNILHFKAAENPHDGAEKVAFDWLSHFYVANPTLGPPVLIITHKDALPEEEFYTLKKSFLSECEKLKEKIARLNPEVDEKWRASFLFDGSKKLFQDDNVFVLSNKHMNFKAIQECLSEKLDHQCREVIPENWDRILRHITSPQTQAESCIEIDTLKEFFHNVPELETVLRYAHLRGKLFWYYNVERLSGYVFHKLEAVIGLLKIVFDHQEETIWTTRVNNFELEAGEDDDMSHDEFKQLVNEFRGSRIMSDRLLRYVVQRECPISPDLAIEILLQFRLIYGPVGKENDQIMGQSHADDNVYLIPSLAGHSDDMGLNSHIPRLRVDIKLTGFTLPRYAYHQMTVSILNHFTDEKVFTDSVAVYNGAIIRRGKSWTCWFSHDHISNTIRIQISLQPHTAHISWNELLTVTEKLLAETKMTWKFIRPKCRQVCTHCLLTDAEQPGKVTNPKFWKTIQRKLSSPAAPEEVCRIKVDDDSSTPCLATRNSSQAQREQVPVALLHPCK